MVGYWYLATPYSKHPQGIEEAFRQAARVAARFAKLGMPIYCPIAHTHPIAMEGGLDPYDHSLWMPLDKPLMEGAVGLIVALLPGWASSAGIAEEIKYFAAAKKPILYHLQPGKEGAE